MDARTRGLRTFLDKGGLVAYPTRAVYGLGCDPENHLALRALLRLKSRPVHKGLIVVADRRDLLRRFHAPLSAEEEARLQARWPGGHTWLVPARQSLTTWLRGRKRGGRGICDRALPCVRMTMRLWPGCADASTWRSSPPVPIAAEGNP
ncbi:SUA5/yciO/yrdC domain protein [mine drainage metagenome]|uniref:L-threonylcarbamoyladenylate synthase n=1 Tax=mine drainage metagenome TaxID=410659 RepID=T0Y3T6_9ZZZZ